jgi:hypothetical protein
MPGEPSCGAFKREACKTLRPWPPHACWSGGQLPTSIQPLLTAGRRVAYDDHQQDEESCGPHG